LDIGLPALHRSGLKTDVTIISETGPWKIEAGHGSRWTAKAKIKGGWLISYYFAIKWWHRRLACAGAG
jgi:hypothetical protein